MTFFNNKSISVYEYSESSTSFNVYGEPEATYTLVGSYDGDFQSTSPSEQVEMGGTIYNDTYKCYLPPDAEVTSTCLVQVDNECYDIIGAPQHYNHIGSISHIKLTLIKHRK